MRCQRSALLTDLLAAQRAIRAPESPRAVFDVGLPEPLPKHLSGLRLETLSGGGQLLHRHDPPVRRPTLSAHRAPSLLCTNGQLNGLLNGLLCINARCEKSCAERGSSIATGWCGGGMEGDG